MDSNIIRLLSEEPVRNMAVLGFFKNYPLARSVQFGDSLVLLGESDHLWGYVSSQSECELTRLFEEPVGTKFFASVEEWMKPVIAKNFEVEWELSTDRYLLPANHPIDPPPRMTCTLEVPFAEYIFDHSDYKAFTSVEYLRDRIARGISAGVIENGTLAAWALTHDDNSLGCLHVLPEFRRKGFAKAIMGSLIIQKRKAGEPVFLNVEPSNISSRNLVTGMGFVLDRKISWIKLK
ncbi:MAG TPA: GNAT family N-acetyltransferase [Bacillota bacterium]